MHRVVSFTVSLSAAATLLVDEPLCSTTEDSSCGLGLLQLQARQKEGGPLAFTPELTEEVCGDVPWSLAAATVSHSNLGNAGPDQGEPTLIFSNVKPGVELVVTATSDYTPNMLNPTGGVLNNKVRNGIGSINLATDTSVTLNFAFRDSASRLPVPQPRFLFSVFDTDQGMTPEARESVTIFGMSGFRVSADSDLKIDEGSSATTFRSMLRGGKVDNPMSPTALTTLQERRTAAALFDAGVTEFNVTFREEHYANPQGRNFLFAGASGIVCSEDDPCTEMHCPAGFGKRTNAEFLECASKPCTDADTATCCYEL
jgi:hypothetical protein